MQPHFSICILSSERPLDTSVLGVAARLPRSDLGDDRSAIRQTPIKTLAIKDADFNFGHVEPAGMLRGVMEYDPSQQGSRLADTQHLLKALAEMGVEIVHDQMDAARLGVDVFEQVLDKGNEVRLGAVVGDRDGTSATLRFHRNEQVAGAASGIFVIVFCRRAGLDRQGLARIPEQLFALLVQADDRFPRLERAGIKIEQVVHAFPVFFGQGTNAPHQLAPRLDAVFFSSRRMVSRLIGPMSACACAACSSNPSVQRLAPSGGVEQAKAVICASTFVAYCRGLPERSTSHSAYSTPPSRYALRVRQMAVRPTPRTEMIWASGIPRSRADKICARLTSRAWCKPFARYNSINSRSSSVRCSSVCRMVDSSSWGGYATVYYM